MLYSSVIDLIGNTPLVKIDPKVHGLKHIDVYAKLEMNNPFGSLKDRISWGIIKDDINSIVEKNQTIIESSSGNTAKALAVLASMHGVPFTTITDRIKVPEVKKILQIIGATIEELPGTSECPDFESANNPVAKIQEKMVHKPGEYFHTEQYTNMKNPQTHYESTGPEILADVSEVDYFIATLGTTGSSRGTAEYLKEQNSNTKVIGVLSSKNDFIPGIRNENETFEVGLYEKTLYDHQEVIESMDALDAMRELIQKSGILAGPTSGASYLGALRFLRDEDKKLTPETRKSAVFVVCDRMEWYVSYIEKRKPEWFGYAVKQHSIRDYSVPSDTASIEISVDDAPQFIQKNQPIIVDLRGALGFKTGHIPNSVNILDKDLTEMLDNGIPFAKNAHILFVCPSGELSKRFSAFLTEKGRSAKSLQGGLLAWRQAGMPLDKGM
jgi:cysteine synthase/rhodanese-related sulfurtransferase